MEEFIGGVVASSFPVAVAVSAWLLLRLERKLEALTDAMRQLQHCRTCVLSPDARSAGNVIDIAAFTSASSCADKGGDNYGA